MRCFIGIPLNSTTQNEIYGVYPRIKDLKFTKKENLHITVKFLGEIKEDKIEKIKEIIGESLNGVEKFAISCNRLSSFPSLTSAKVIWVNVIQGSKIIEKIYNRLEDKLEKTGIQKENRKYIPHITIARTRNAVDITDYLRNFDINSAAESIVLFKSDLKPDGPFYTKIFEHNFKG
ncbi:MAG: RNA 2',3'-cyclic phosphodiesterase [Candidatus Goldbacteria bacterium]|nr:RNA 2',3'-cyclic phosphodiesterase [Candidatus Goldiibacteriota bacterium]